VGKYSNFSKQEGDRLKKGVHPVWRGVGFLLMFLIPVLSYFGMIVLLDENGKRGWVPIQPDWLIKIGPDPLLLVKIGVALALVIILFAILMFITFLINSLFAPSRYGPLDVPPATYRKRKSR
jgi:hypothetical protein